MHISYLDEKGGAHIAARRICEAQIKNGIDARMMVVNKGTSKPFVKEWSFKFKILNMAMNLLSTVLLKFQKKKTNPILNSLNFFPSRRHVHINRSDVDIVNLHWVNGETINIREIGKITKPIVWTMHDMWPFSGAEHYDDLSNPDRYKTGYTKENRPKEYSGWDLDKYVFNKKVKHFSNKMHLVCPSSWLVDSSLSSKLFSSNPHSVVPNTLNEDIFKPLDKIQARNILNLPKDNQMVLFGAFSANDDPRKGYVYLKEAIEILELSAKNLEVEFVVFGGEERSVENIGSYKVHHIGKVTDEYTLSILYNSVDLFVAPSLQDNLPNTILESLACGTPIVSFMTGGIPDMVKNGISGYLVPSVDANLLAEYILKALQNPEKFKCREFFSENFNQKRVSGLYLGVYEELLRKKVDGKNKVLLRAAEED